VSNGGGPAGFDHGVSVTSGGSGRDLGAADFTDGAVSEGGALAVEQLDVAPTMPQSVKPEARTLAPGFRRKLVLITIAIAALTAFVDQLTKIWAISALSDGRRIPILGQFLAFRYLRNPGAALGLGYGYTWILTIVVIGVIIGIAWVARRLGSLAWAWALGLLLGGAIGNLIDRLFRMPGFGHGHVVDFIAYWNWFVGNVADIAIVVAAGLIILLSLRGISVDGSIDRD